MCSEEAQLLLARWIEATAVKSCLAASRIEPEPLAGSVEPLAEQIGVWPPACLAETEPVVIIPSAASLAYEAHYARMAIREVRLQPLIEDVLYLVRQPEKDIGGLTGSGVRRRFKDPLDLIVVQRRDDRRQQNADRDSSRRELFHGLEARLR